METLFLSLFVSGLAFIILSFLLGFAQAELPVPGLHEFHLELGDGGADVHASPFSVSTIATFVTWFGGIGYLLTVQSALGGVLVFLLSGLGGLAGATLVFLVLARFLYAGQTAPMRAEDYRIEGTLARVSLPMTGSRTGEIIFTKHGFTRSEGARSADGSPLPRGTEVVVLRYERGIAYVEPLEKLLAERDDRPAPLSEGREGGTRT